jgi:hypothetical protein
MKGCVCRQLNKDMGAVRDDPSTFGFMASANAPLLLRTWYMVQR